MRPGADCQGASDDEENNDGRHHNAFEFTEALYEELVHKVN
jgi:hypothetical protein